MKIFTINRMGLKLLTLFTFVVLGGAIAVADNGGEDMRPKEVLTTLEQRMQKRISVDFRDTPIDDVIRIMAEQADVDILKSPKVIGRVTAKLTNVPLEEALNNILAAHGYGYVVGKNMIRVAPMGEITERAERLISKIYTITYADVTEVEKALKKFISNRGSLSSNSGTSNLIVTDTATKIRAIDTFVEEIDRITPQVLVEVRIYDITSQDTLDLGVEWQAGRDTVYNTTSGIGTLGINPTKDRDPFMTGIFSGATGKTSGTTGALRFGWLNSGIDIDVALRAQQEKIHAKLLANPRILVLDNETAKFEIIREIPYEEESDSSAGGTLTSTEFKEVGVKLEVTPHIARDDMLRLHIVPEFGVVVGTLTAGSPPTIDTRRIDTIALVRDGQTVVLGGLRKKEISQQTNKIPLLGDLPLVGVLFKFEGEDTVNSEIVVFITPRIIKQPVMSEAELQQFEVTEFSGPKPTDTRAEKSDK